MLDIRCTYCHACIAGVESLEDSPDVVILYAHRTCHAQAVAGLELAAASQLRVRTMVGRMCNRQHVPAWRMWTVLSRFVVPQGRRKEPQP
jgi:uncharacterized membrane protein